MNSNLSQSVARYDGAVLLLPHGLREAARRLAYSDRAEAEEIRLRTGCPPTALTSRGEIPLSETAVTKRDIDGVLDIATGVSAHSSADSIRAGYITVRGGYRIGLCGSAIMRDGAVTGFRTLTSASIRIPREIKGIAGEVARQIMTPHGVMSTLIVSPPGAGKTTLLRDLVRILSEGDAALGVKGYRVALADERSEVAAVFDGAAQMDVGPRTDVLDSCPKADAVIMLLRAMNPEIIALDEITAPEDTAAIESAANCGVRLIATAHASGLEELYGRALYNGLIEKRIFGKAVFIRRGQKGWSYRVCDLEARHD